MRAIHHFPLSVRIPLLAAGLMILVGIIASQQVLSTLGQEQDARIRELAQLHVDALSVALGPHVLRNDIWEVYDTLKRSAGGADGRRTVFTVVADRNGNILAATNPRRAPIGTPLKPFIKGAQSPQSLSVAGKAKLVRLFAPLSYQGREVGQIVTELDVSDLIAERHRTGQLLLFWNTLATGVLALLGYLVMRRMLQPITRLAQRMNETASAPRPIPAKEIPRNDTELTRLVHTYNAMATAVEAKAGAERRLAERERFVSLGRLAASLAHEINNPLGGMLNSVDTIHQYANRPDVVRRSARLLKRALNHLRDVTGAALEHNRLDRSGATLTAEDFDDLRLLIGPEVTRQGQKLEWQVKAPSGVSLPGLPAAPARQIALNLLLNASSAAGRGGKLRFHVSTTENVLNLSMSDSGPGLPAAAKERLLSDGPVLPDGGGVGLRIVHDLVSRLGGTIATAMVEGMAEIRVSLPVAGDKAGPTC